MITGEVFYVRKIATGEILSCYIDKKGNVYIGLDTFRFKDKMDYPSYDYKKFNKWSIAAEFYEKIDKEVA